MKTPFVTKDQLEAIAAQYPTPFHIYDSHHGPQAKVFLWFHVKHPPNSLSSKSRCFT